MMEQQAETQANMSQDQLKYWLTWYRYSYVKENVTQKPRIRTIPITYLTAYPELTEALPLIEEDFFRTPLTEEERKIAIHSCPKTSSINYIPPPLSNSASSAVKKADTVMYEIQLALAQATRPIDYYVHRRIQETPGNNTALSLKSHNLHKGLDLPGRPTQLVESDTKPLMDQEALDTLMSKKPVVKRQRVQPFRRSQQNTIPMDTYSSNTATVQSTNAATTAEANSSNSTADRQSNFRGRGRGRGRVTQYRPKTAHQTPTLSLRYRGFRYENSVYGRIFAGNDIDSTVPPVSKGAFLAPFETGGTWRAPEVPAPSVSPSNSTADVPSTSVQEEVKPKDQQSSDRRSRFLTIEESYRRDSTEGSRLLQPTFHDHKEDWRPRPVLDFRKLIQHVEEQNFKMMTLAYPRCVHAYTSIQELQEVSPLSLERPMLPVPRPTIRAITEPVGIYQDSTPSSGMGQNLKDARLGLPRRSSDNWGNEGGVCSNHTLDILQALGAWIQGQRREIVYLPIPVYHTPGYGYQYKENDPQGSVNQGQGSSTGGKQATERWDDDIEMSRELYWESSVNVDCTAAGSPYASPTSRTKESINADAEIMDIDSNPDETCHSEPIIPEEQTERHGLGNSGGIPHVLRIMESKRGKDAHKRQGAANSIVRPKTQEGHRSISVGLFRQHNHSCVREKIRRNNFPRTSQDSRTDLESLSGNEYQTSGHLCTVGAQSCRCAEQTDCANRMVSITGNIQNSEFSLWPAQRRPVCIPPEQEGGNLLHLVPRHRVSRPECNSLQLVRVQQPIQLP
ncbi:hypothetical protein AYI69_g2739, partial [Smittium culicis]